LENQNSPLGPPALDEAHVPLLVLFPDIDYKFFVGTYQAYVVNQGISAPQGAVELNGIVALILEKGK